MTLDLGNTGCAAAGIAALASLLNNRSNSLVSLLLYRNALPADSLLKLAQSLASNTCLRTLELRGVGDALNSPAVQQAFVEAMTRNRCLLAINPAPSNAVAAALAASERAFQRSHAVQRGELQSLALGTRVLMKSSRDDSQLWLLARVTEQPLMSNADAADTAIVHLEPEGFPTKFAESVSLSSNRVCWLKADAKSPFGTKSPTVRGWSSLPQHLICLACSWLVDDARSLLRAFSSCKSWRAASIDKGESLFRAAYARRFEPESADDAAVATAGVDTSFRIRLRNRGAIARNVANFALPAKQTPFARLLPSEVVDLALDKATLIAQLRGVQKSDKAQLHAFNLLQAQSLWELEIGLDCGRLQSVAQTADERAFIRLSERNMLLPLAANNVPLDASSCNLFTTFGRRGMTCDSARALSFVNLATQQTPVAPALTLPPNERLCDGVLISECRLVALIHVASSTELRCYDFSQRCAEGDNKSSEQQQPTCEVLHEWHCRFRSLPLAFDGRRLALHRTNYGKGETDDELYVFDLLANPRLLPDAPIETNGHCASFSLAGESLVISAPFFQACVHQATGCCIVGAATLCTASICARSKQAKQLRSSSS